MRLRRRQLVLLVGGERVRQRQPDTRLPVRQPPAARLRRAPGRRGARPRHGLPHGRDEVRARRARGRRGAGGRALCARAGDRPRRPLRGRRLRAAGRVGRRGGGAQLQRRRARRPLVRRVRRGAVEARAPRRARVLRQRGRGRQPAQPAAARRRAHERGEGLRGVLAALPAHRGRPRRQPRGRRGASALERRVLRRGRCPGASCRGSSRTRASTIWATGSWGGRSRTACAWCAGIPACGST